MTTDKRIKLRDDLFNELDQKHLIFTHSKGNLCILKSNLDKARIIDKYQLYISQFRSEEEALFNLLRHTDISENLCPICHEPKTFRVKHHMYGQSCGKKECYGKLINTDESLDKRKKTWIENYGVDNPAKCKEIQDNIKQTNLKLYGSENPFGSKMIQEKIKNTNMDKYGAENPFGSKMIQEKIKHRNLELYGHEHPLQSPELLDKMKHTNVERYGYDYAMKNEVVKEKQRRSYFTNHGVKNPFIIDEYDFILKNMRTEFQNNDLQFVDIYSNNEYFMMFVKRMYDYKAREIRLYEISSIFGVSKQTVKLRLKSLNGLDYVYTQDSQLELKIKIFLEDHQILFERFNRSILYPKEIDIFLPNNNIGIEVNDIESHNVKDKGISYHYDKTINAMKKNVRLIHIWEWELMNKFLWNRLSNWILNLINNQKNRIYARKCDLRLVSLNEEKQFLTQYHLQGYKKSDVCYGLYFNNELVQLMSFCKPRYNKNYNYELLRLCTKYGYSIISGSKRLLNHFIKDYKPTSIISYCSLDKFTGKVYEDLGFTLNNYQPQIMWYNEETNKLFSHSSLTMKGADKLIGTNYGKGTNNEEIAWKSGYEKVFTSGLNVYVMKF